MATSTNKSTSAPKGFAVRTTFNSTGVVIFDGLAARDHQTAARLFDDVMHLRDSVGMPFATLRKVTGRTSMLEELADLRRLCLAGLRPIIHIEGHGERDVGLRLGEDRELLSWTEIGAALTEMNHITRNNLGVVVGACHGFYLVNNVSIERPCPYFFLVAPTEEVSAGLIEDRMPRFYRTLLATRSFDHASATLGPDFQEFLAEKFFCLTFARHMRDHSIGRGGERHVEELLTKAVREGKAANRDERRSLRKRFRVLVKSPEAIYYRMSRTFLHGRRAANFLTLKAFVQTAYST